MIALGEGAKRPSEEEIRSGETKFMLHEMWRDQQTKSTAGRD